MVKTCILNFHTCTWMGLECSHGKMPPVVVFVAMAMAPNGATLGVREQKKKSVWDQMMCKVWILMTSVFLVLTTTALVAFTLRETHLRILRFTVQLRYHNRNRSTPRLS